MKRFLSALPALLLLAACAVLPAAALSSRTALEETARWVHAAVPQPQSASVGGEWAVIGLARSGLEVPSSWYASYRDALTDLVVQQQGVLSQRKYTEYARAVLALTALGQDPRDVAGYDLLSPLFDARQVERQGINGTACALIALDCGDYPAPDGLRETYLAVLLSAQLPDGGWALSGTTSDPDLTAQVLQALAPYRSQAEEAVSRGLALLTDQADQGSIPTLEGCAQAIIALCTLGETPSQTLLDAFFSYRLADGSFRHLPDGQADGMASEQALCALAALVRREDGLPALYQMDPPAAQESGEPAQLLLLSPAMLWLVPACVLGQIGR